MTDEKVNEVMDLYGNRLTTYAESRPKNVDHLLSMIPTIRGFIAEGRREKAMRWLGFMQGVLWAEGIYTLHELMDHNRPNNSEFDESA